MKIPRQVPGGKDEIWVSPRFYLADFDAKKFVSNVLAFRFYVPKGGKLRSKERMSLVDSKSGKLVGYYDAGGLTLE